MPRMKSEAALVAELNDLLQLDHDAVQAYNLALKGLEDVDLKRALTRFRGHHRRHIRDLTELIEAHDGVPIQLSHIPTGPMKLAVQAIGNLGSDREVLLAFRSNERQSRNKYRRAAEARYPDEVAQLLERHATDEEKHYRWVMRELEAMGVGPRSRVGRAVGAFSAIHAKSADTIEGVERFAMAGAERARRSPIPAILLGVVGLLLIGRALRSDR